MKTIRILLTLVILLTLGGAAFVWSGAYPIGADVPHWPLTFKLLETLRDRSVAEHAKGLQVPALDDPKLVAEGAQHYEEMCTGCHLAPGVTESDLRAGLYPQPPDFSKGTDLTPAEAFWTIKHGIKLSAMPAWGATHNDRKIWAIVAFVGKLSDMTPEQYKALTGGEKSDESHHHHEQEGDAPMDAGHQPGN
jgi:mono/diheme cytochrome c family protein